MKIVHIESGLGNQMLDYCDFLACKYSNPQEDIYIENMLYEMNEATETISMWNGYELKKVFGIEEKNIKTIFSEKQWEEIKQDVRKSEFWKHDWDYSNAITEAFMKQGLILKNLNTPRKGNELEGRKKRILKIYRNLKKTEYGYYLNKILVKLKFNDVNRLTKNQPIFYKDSNDLYTGHFLKFMYKGSGIEKIEDEVRKRFVFPPFQEESNKGMANFIATVNSVSVHIRRGDFLKLNNLYYENGYFKRAIKYMRKNVERPQFILFCDPGSRLWVKDNLYSLGFEKRDEIYFVDWNLRERSYKDMQLMSLCKNNIITNSSFGWWGAFLNENEDKITCSPHEAINTTHWF